MLKMTAAKKVTPVWDEFLQLYSRERGLCESWPVHF
jgi:hypothetical protein